MRCVFVSNDILLSSYVDEDMGRSLNFETVCGLG
jgi:hypothetical protein